MAPHVAPAVDPLLDYRQARAALGCSESTLLRLIAAGRLTPVYVARRTPRIRASALNALRLTKEDHDR